METVGEDVLTPAQRSCSVLLLATERPFILPHLFSLMRLIALSAERFCLAQKFNATTHVVLADFNIIVCIENVPTLILVQNALTDQEQKKSEVSNISNV